LKFTFNNFGLIDSLTYIGNINICYNSLVSLVGLHETYLNDLLKHYEVKLVEDIPEFLSENWAIALYHDNFSKLILKLKNVIQEAQDIRDIVANALSNKLVLDRKNMKNILGQVSEDTKKVIETEILLFLLENRNHLQMYHIPEIKD